MTWIRRLWCKTFHFPHLEQASRGWIYSCLKCESIWEERS